MLRARRGQLANWQRWGEMTLCSRLAGKNTRIGLIVHTEGLFFKRVVRTLTDFGRELAGEVRPTLATTTPLCPAYFEDPFSGKSRRRFARRALPDRADEGFASTLSDLAEYYEVGYHGHFYALQKDVYVPTNDAGKIASQFRNECDLISRAGFKPRTYAGGWWILTQSVASLLDGGGFTLDTTANELGIDSFGSLQDPVRGIGSSPYWITDSLLEIPTIRSGRAMLYSVPVDKRNDDNFFFLYLHDYDLAAAWGRVFKQFLLRMCNLKRLVSSEELAEESSKWLHSQGVARE